MKRARTSSLSSTSTKPSRPLDHLVIVAQNVETLVPLLQELAQPKLNFFKPSPAKRQRRHSSSPPSSSSEDASTTTTRLAPKLNPPPNVMTQWNPAMYLINEHLPHIICLQEVKALAKDTDLKRAIPLVTDPINNGSTGANRYTAHSSLSHAKKGRNFGVTTYVRDDVKVVRAREVDWDKEGRVMIIELEEVVVFNVYALNGSDYPWINPDTGKPQGTRNERKRHFNHLLMLEVQHYNQKSTPKPCLLIGDFNISLTALDCHPRLRTEYPHDVARAAFRKDIIPGMGVVDLFRHLYGDVKAYSWFAVGKPHRSDCARVDFALLSEGAVGAAVKMEYMEMELGRSDHCPMVVVLDRGKLRTDGEVPEQELTEYPGTRSLINRSAQIQLKTDTG